MEKKIFSNSLLDFLLNNFLSITIGSFILFLGMIAVSYIILTFWIKKVAKSDLKQKQILKKKFKLFVWIVSIGYVLIISFCIVTIGIIFSSNAKTSDMKKMGEAYKELNLKTPEYNKIAKEAYRSYLNNGEIKEWQVVSFMHGVQKLQLNEIESKKTD